MYPNLNEEHKLWRQGYIVAGLDESGRGPLAGPIIAAAIMLNRKFRNRGIRDSKQLSPKKREELYNFLINHKDVKWGVGKVSEKLIDRINILEATKLAMEKAVRDLERKTKIDFLILDGNFKINLLHLQKSVIKGDEKVLSCAAASIIAKVTRDRLMLKYHNKYPQYGFDRHKGYGTKLHYEMIKEHKISAIHRRTFIH